MVLEYNGILGIDTHFFGWALVAIDCTFDGWPHGHAMRGRHRAGRLRRQHSASAL